MENMKILEKKLCKELDELAEKGEISASALSTIHILTDTIKNIKKIEMFEEGEEYSQAAGMQTRGVSEYGRGRSYGDGSSYGGGSSYGNESSYDGGGNAYARNSYAGASSRSGRHYVRGHYSRDSYARGGYSRAEAGEKMVMQLEEMMEDATSEKERRAIEKAIRMIEGD